MEKDLRQLSIRKLQTVSQRQCFSRWMAHIFYPNIAQEYKCNRLTAVGDEYPKLIPLGRAFSENADIGNISLPWIHFYVGEGVILKPYVFTFWDENIIRVSISFILFIQVHDMTNLFMRQPMLKAGWHCYQMFITDNWSLPRYRKTFFEFSHEVQCNVVVVSCRCVHKLVQRAT